jgi:hypothetical protein
LTAEGPPVRRLVRPVTPKNGCNLQAACEMRPLCTDPILKPEYGGWKANKWMGTLPPFSLQY